MINASTARVERTASNGPARMPFCALPETFCALPEKCRVMSPPVHGVVVVLPTDTFEIGGSDMLTSSEQKRADSFRNEIDRKNFVVGRIARARHSRHRRETST